jgi:hypothetical protein
MSHQPRCMRDRLGEVRRILCAGEMDDSDRNCHDFVRRHSGQRPHLKFLHNLWPPFHPTLLTANRPCRDSVAAGQRILPLHAILWRSNRMMNNQYHQILLGGRRTSIVLQESPLHSGLRDDSSTARSMKNEHRRLPHP